MEEKKVKEKPIFSESQPLREVELKEARKKDMLEKLNNKED